jgi:hypothetical protein
LMQIAAAHADRLDREDDVLRARLRPGNFA